MVELSIIRHAYPEPYGITIDRPNGYGEYTFLHFFQSVKLLVKGKLITTSPGAVIFYGADTVQYYTTSEPLVHNWMHMTGGLPEMLEKYSLGLDTVYYPENPAFITELVYECEAEFYGNREHRDVMLNLKLEELFLKLSRALNGQSTPSLNADSKKKFQQLRRKMLSDLSKHMSNAEMAKEVGFSESRFHRIYKSLYGISPTNDMINARIERSKQLLFSESKTVSEIAEALGYENITHFIRQFKAKTNCSPTEYRKIYRKSTFSKDE